MFEWTCTFDHWNIANLIASTTCFQALNDCQQGDVLSSDSMIEDSTELDELDDFQAKALFLVKTHTL